MAQTDGTPVHFVYHVPKCAGRTIDRHLATALPQAAYHLTKKRRGLGRFITRYDPAHLPDPRPIRVVSGHFLGASMEAAFTGRPLKRSILLRDPVSHLVSYYNFRMVRYIERGLQPYGFELAYGATQRNFITHYILRNFLELPWLRIASLPDNDKYDLVNAFLSSFWFVGDYRLCDELIAALAERLAIPESATPRNTLAELTGSVGWSPLTADRLPPQVVAQIQAENALDQRLWETWREARHDTGMIRPRAFDGTYASAFILDEASRFVNQILRRIQRRWGADGIGVPAPHGDSPTPV